MTKNDVTIRSFGKPTTKPSEKTSGSLALVIRATENSWISVLADGQLVTQETLIAPANTSVHASSEIVVKIGNAAGVTFLWNGQETPAAGSEGEVKSFTFDAQGMRPISSSVVKQGIAPTARPRFPPVPHSISAIRFILSQLASKPLRAREPSVSLFVDFPNRRSLDRGRVDFRGPRPENKSRVFGCITCMTRYVPGVE